MKTVKRAIILAAGKGTRLQPLTIDTPKSLIEVNGKKILDTIIDGLHQNNIHEIYLVVGYLKEKFYEWLENKHDNNIIIIENPNYDNSNNISSLYAVKDYIDDCFIMDSDLIINNPDVLSTKFNKSGYNCTWTDDFTNEWVLSTDENEIINSCSRVGGRKGWKLYSISRWSKQDGNKLKQYLIEEFDRKKNINIYWDDIALFCYPKDFELSVYKMKQDDVVEVDSLEELIQIDSSYNYILERKEK